jgi:hypothetical protein
MRKCIRRGSQTSFNRPQKDNSNKRNSVQYNTRQTKIIHHHFTFFGGIIGGDIKISLGRALDAWIIAALPGSAPN